MHKCMGSIETRLLGTIFLRMHELEAVCTLFPIHDFLAVLIWRLAVPLVIRSIEPIDVHHCWVRFS